jgi:CheY-like chemotaxis protein
MKYDLEQFIDEAIKLELNAAEIYAIFAAGMKEDADFWAGLSWEERNHAAILKTGKEMLLPAGQFPEELLFDFIQPLVETNTWLQALKDEFSEKLPDRLAAFAIAIKIEKSAGEMHFQRVMEQPSDSRFLEILQDLCEDDIDHLNRIVAYMRQSGLSDALPETVPKSILVVMADDSVAKLLRTILKTEGDIDIAGSGREGLRRIGAKNYDLVISSVGMEDMDGPAFYQAATKTVPGLSDRFLFFTGGATTGQISFFAEENIRYLEKPASISKIRTAVQGMLREPTTA